MTVQTGDMNKVRRPEDVSAKKMEEMTVWGVPLALHWAFLLVDLGGQFFPVPVQLFDAIPHFTNEMNAHRVRDPLVFSEALTILGDAIFGDSQVFLRAWLNPVKWEAQPVRNSCGHCMMIGIERVINLKRAAGPDDVPTYDANTFHMTQPVTVDQYASLVLELKLAVRSMAVANGDHNK